MGRIVSKATLEDGTVVEVWTGSPGHGRVHLGINGSSEPLLSFLPREADVVAVLLGAARTRMLSWNQAYLDLEDVELSTPDVSSIDGEMD